MDVAICCFYTWRHTCALGPMKEPPTREKVLQVFAKNQVRKSLRAMITYELVGLNTLPSRVVDQKHVSKALYTIG